VSYLGQNNVNNEVMNQCMIGWSYGYTQLKSVCGT